MSIIHRVSGRTWRHRADSGMVARFGRHVAVEPAGCAKGFVDADETGGSASEPGQVP
jgi:hypothetical protein